MTSSLTSAIARVSRIWLLRGVFSLQSMLLMFQYSDRYAEKKDNIYNILWVLVFGFATLNILGLVTRRFEPRRAGLNFGEIVAVTVVVVSLVLLGLEMLNVFRILPIRLPIH